MLVAELRAAALGGMRRSIKSLLEVYGFREDEADEAVLPLLEGRWETDLFNPETLREAGKRLGTGAAVGAAIGLAADVASAGLSLGTGSLIGAAIGGLASQGVGPVSRKLMNRARGVQEVTLENEVLLIMAEHMVRLLWALEQRGHAASGKVAVGGNAVTAMTDEMNAMMNTLQAARGHPEWDVSVSPRQAGGAQRESLIDTVAAKLGAVVALEKNDEI
jgi:hypothetical protein